MPRSVYTFYWGDEIVNVCGRTREEAWSKVDKERYSSPYLTIDSLVWSGWEGGYMFDLN